MLVSHARVLLLRSLRGGSSNPSSNPNPGGPPAYSQLAVPSSFKFSSITVRPCRKTIIVQCLLHKQLVRMLWEAKWEAVFFFLKRVLRTLKLNCILFRASLGSMILIVSVVSELFLYCQLEYLDSLKNLYLFRTLSSLISYSTHPLAEVSVKSTVG